MTGNPKKNEGFAWRLLGLLSFILKFSNIKYSSILLKDFFFSQCAPVLEKIDCNRMPSIAENAECFKDSYSMPITEVKKKPPRIQCQSPAVISGNYSFFFFF